jgi:hypothetical protein
MARNEVSQRTLWETMANAGNSLDYVIMFLVVNWLVG